MFKLGKYRTYDSSLEQVIAESIEIAHHEPTLIDNAIRWSVARYDGLSNNSPLKLAISELCRGCDILIRAEKARVRMSKLHYVAWKKCVRWYAIVMNFLPFAGTFIASALFNYQSSIFTAVTSIDDNASVNNTRDVITSLPYFVVLAGQSYIVTLFFGWFFGLAYGLSVPGAGVLALNMTYSDDCLIKTDREGWRERLRTEEIERVVQSYVLQQATSHNP